jgi:hypothetical protein
MQNMTAGSGNLEDGPQVSVINYNRSIQGSSQSLAEKLLLHGAQRARRGTSTAVVAQGGGVTAGDFFNGE